MQLKCEQTSHLALLENVDPTDQSMSQMSNFASTEPITALQ